MSYVIIYRPILHVSKCNMSLGMTDPNFQEDLGIIPLFMGKVNVVADITSDHYVSRGSIIPFDQKILDNTNSFVLNNSTFIGIVSNKMSVTTIFGHTFFKGKFNHKKI